MNNTVNPSALDELNVAVDLDTFRFALELYQAAYSGKYPINPMDYTVPLNGKVYCFTDEPLNRAGIAISKELNHLSRTHLMSLLYRILHLGDLIKNGRLKAWLKPDPQVSDGSYMLISESLLYAAAKAPFTNNGRFDIGQVINLARQHESEEASQ